MSLPTRDEALKFIAQSWVTATPSTIAGQWLMKARADGTLKTDAERDTRIRTLERENRKLQERLNRIANAMIGNQRIWQLDRLAMECKVEADRLVAKAPHNPVDAQLARKYAAQHRADALFLRRLEWDLRTLHVAVKGDTNRRGGRYDQANWKGPRP